MEPLNLLPAIKNEKDLLRYCVENFRRIDNKLNNYSGITDLSTNTFVESDPATVYPDGLSLMPVTSPNWPLSFGLVETVKSRNSDYTRQIITQYYSAVVPLNYMRRWIIGSSAWSDWTPIGLGGIYSFTISSDQSIANATLTTLALNANGGPLSSPRDDMDDITLVSNKLQTNRAGVYRLNVNLQWDNVSSGSRLLWVKDNSGSVIAGARHPAHSSTEQNAGCIIETAANDQIYVDVWQNTGVSIPVVAGLRTYFQAQRIG